MWQAFIDESGDREHSPVLVLAGWIAPFENWKKFTVDWGDMLTMRPSIEYFKMDEADGADGQFRDWNPERINERIARAYRIIEDHVGFQASAIIDIAAFDRVFPPFVDEKSRKRKFYNPYYVAFQGIISSIARHRYDQGLNEKIDFIFDKREMEKKNIRDAWDLLKERFNEDTKSMMGSDPRFEDDKEFLPLQAADLLAWWIRRMATEESDGIQKFDFPWKPTRSIPAFQFHYDEALLRKIRESMNGGVWAALAAQSS
jgi:hypothetical protein